MSIPDFTKTPDDELERIIRTEGPFCNAASHEWHKRQSKRAISQLSKPHWTLTPAFCVTVAAMLFAAIAAWPVIQGWFQSSRPAGKAASSQQQQSQSTPSLPTAAKMSASSDFPNGPPNNRLHPDRQKAPTGPP